MRKSLASRPLFWRVFWGNAAVLVVVVAALVFGPSDVSAPLTLAESLLLVTGVALALAISLVLMRPAFRPFDELADHMRRHDPLAPGNRVDVEGGPNVTALARAFNEMLDRLEAEQRESARRALMVQEGERQRVARELHDEVGQTLTGVMLQVEGLAARIPAELREDLDELRETARSGAEDVRRIVRVAAARGTRGPRAAQCAGGACDSVSRPGRRPCRAAARGRPAAVCGAGAGLLPRRPGGDHERRPARRRVAGRDPAPTRRRGCAADGPRRRRRPDLPLPTVPRTASAACASARC